MKLAKKPVFPHYFCKSIGILLFVLKYMYISLPLKIINGFSWPAKIMASPLTDKAKIKTSLFPVGYMHFILALKFTAFHFFIRT